jgi:DNA adenine methylase
MVEPILKWAGGKRQILKEILSLFPRDYKRRTYHEPMVGGGAVVFAIAPERGTINDLNDRLMRFYEVVRDFPEELIEENKKHRNDRDYYYQARREFNKLAFKGELTHRERIIEASLFLYLNRTCFNGLYRVNSKGEFNVPFGRYSNPDFVRERQILEASKILKNLRFFKTDFSYVLREAKEGDLVYFDPPYEPVSETSNFTQYTCNGFDFEQQRRLRDVCVELHKMGVYFVLSNSWAEPVRKLYQQVDGFEIKRIEARREISAKVDSRKPVYEILVTNVPPSLRMG